MAYWWATISADMKDVLSTCIPCIRYNVQKLRFLLLRSMTTDRAWDHISNDLVRQLPLRENGYDTLPVITNIMKTLCILHGLSGKDMETTAKFRKYREP